MVNARPLTDRLRLPQRRQKMDKKKTAGPTTSSAVRVAAPMARVAPRADQAHVHAGELLQKRLGNQGTRALLTRLAQSASADEARTSPTGPQSTKDEDSLPSFGEGVKNVFRGRGYISDKEFEREVANRREAYEILKQGGVDALETFYQTHPDKIPPVSEAGAGGLGKILLRTVSRIKESGLLAREAEAAGRSVQKSLDHLVDSLSKGNLNPGIGTKPIGGGISEARARDGARVYFRKIGERIEILGKSAKDNQQKVIAEIHKIFGG
jgi:putative component of toxin-antitoxin plasmid stabilization module